jgi:hypothetical protein
MFLETQQDPFEEDCLADFGEVAAITMANQRWSTGGVQSYAEEYQLSAV